MRFDVISLFPQSPDRTIFVHSMLVPEPPRTEEERDHFRRSFKKWRKGLLE